jgi:hypothetical protein
MNGLIARTHNSGICNSRADGKSIGDKSLFSFSYRLTEFFRRQMLPSAIKTTISDSIRVTECYCPAVANT